VAAPVTEKTVAKLKAARKKRAVRRLTNRPGMKMNRYEKSLY